MHLAQGPLPEVVHNFIIAGTWWHVVGVNFSGDHNLEDAVHQKSVTLK